MVISPAGGAGAAWSIKQDLITQARLRPAPCWLWLACQCAGSSLSLAQSRSVLASLPPLRLSGSELEAGSAGPGHRPPRQWTRANLPAASLRSSYNENCQNPTRMTCPRSANSTATRQKKIGYFGRIVFLTRRERVIVIICCEECVGRRSDPRAGARSCPVTAAAELGRPDSDQTSQEKRDWMSQTQYSRDLMWAVI